MNAQIEQNYTYETPTRIKFYEVIGDSEFFNDDLIAGLSREIEMMGDDG